MKGIRIFTLLAAVLAVLLLATACSTNHGPTSVFLEPGSWGIPGNGTVTGLTSGKKYYVATTGGQIYSVKANGTLGEATGYNDQAAFLSGNTITGLTNGVSYFVVSYTKPTYTSQTTTLGAGDYNTVINIEDLSDGEDHTIAVSAKPAAKYVVIYVGQELTTNVSTAVGIDTQKTEGTPLDYTFGTTTPDGATYFTGHSMMGDNRLIFLDLGALTGGTFTTTITVSNH